MQPQALFVSRSARRALLMLQAKPGSLCRCAQSTLRAGCEPRQEERGPETRARTGAFPQAMVLAPCVRLTREQGAMAKAQRILVVLTPGVLARGSASLALFEEALRADEPSEKASRMLNTRGVSSFLK